MLCAVEINGWNSMLFVQEPPVEDEDWTVEKGVEIDVPDDLDLWPQNDRRPIPTLCRSLTNRKHFRVFKYPEEFDKTKFEMTGKNWVGLYSKENFEQHAKRVIETLKLLRAVPDDDEAPAH